MRNILNSIQDDNNAQTSNLSEIVKRFSFPFFVVMFDGTTSGVRRKFSWGAFGSASNGGHLYWVCAVCDFTI